MSIILGTLCGSTFCEIIDKNEVHPSTFMNINNQLPQASSRASNPLNQNLPSIGQNPARAQEQNSYINGVNMPR